MLALHAGKVLSVDDLLAQVWGAEYLGEPQVVYVHIRWLREKLEADPSKPARIITVRGKGYKLVDPGSKELPRSSPGSLKVALKPPVAALKALFPGSSIMMVVQALAAGRS